MKLIVLPVGPLEANCYLLGDGQSEMCVVIDPGGDAEIILETCTTESLRPHLILLTHGHMDHMAAAAAVKAASGARVMIHEADRESVEHPHPFWAQMVGGAPAVRVDECLTDGQAVGVGGLSLRVLHTPGHSPGSVCFLGDGLILTGDTLFAGSVGRTDLPGGSMQLLEQSLQRIIAATAPDTVVYPGHGPASTIGEELAGNPWLQ
ncbi:MAG: MBL fold metallo-hydrolase [Armatimonadetes bacterium]|nr:MBL fold metallo-hydrolase [Armatimonadota bacterium]